MSDAEGRGRDKLDLDSVTLMSLIVAVPESVNIGKSGLVLTRIAVSTFWECIQKAPIRI